MGAIEMRAKAFAAEHGLKEVRFHKRWHKFDIYTAESASEDSKRVYFLVDDEGIRMATPSESERFDEGHHVESTMP